MPLQTDFQPLIGRDDLTELHRMNAAYVNGMSMIILLRRKQNDGEKITDKDAKLLEESKVLVNTATSEVNRIIENMKKALAQAKRLV